MGQMKNFALKAKISNAILQAMLDMAMLPFDVGVVPLPPPMPGVVSTLPGHFLLSGSLWVMFEP